MEPFNEFDVNSANQTEMQQSYKQQGWIPMQARRQERLKKLALLDTWSPAPGGSNGLPGAQDASQGFGSPFGAAGESPQRMKPDGVKYDNLMIPEKKRFPKITRQPEHERDGAEDMAN